MSEFQIGEGFLEVWAQDVSILRVYPFRFDDGGPRRVGELLDDTVFGALRDMSIPAGFQPCRGSRTLEPLGSCAG